MSRTQVAPRRQEIFEVRRSSRTDCGALREFLTGLSPPTRYLRFFSGAAPIGPAMLAILAGGSRTTDVLVATAGEQIIGHGMAGDSTGPDGSHLTEIGVVVADGHRGRGVGSALVRTLLARARARGATAVVMEVLAENRQVLTMIADHWPVTLQERSGAYITIHAGLPVPGPPVPRPPLPGPTALGWPALRIEEERHDGRLAGIR